MLFPKTFEALEKTNAYTHVAGSCDTATNEQSAVGTVLVVGDLGKGVRKNDIGTGF